jgi:hypothetical protein
MTEHDPGGKSRFKLPAGVVGGAEFVGPNREYRSMLWRAWGEEAARGDPTVNGAAFVMFVGMNPSTAEANVNDPTVCWECNRTREWGLSAYVKTNVMDYRSTDPKMLLRLTVDPCSAGNLETIRMLAALAFRTVVTFGSLPKPLRPYGEHVVRQLRRDGIQLWCIGTTADGSPRHPRGVSRNVVLQEFRG